MQAERDRLEQQRARVSDQVEAAKRDTDISSLQKRRGVLDFELQEGTKHLMQLRFFRTQADAALAALKEQEADGSIVVSADIVNALDRDPMLRGLKNLQLNMITARDNLMQKYGPRHPQVEGYHIRLASCEREITTMTNRLTNQYVNLMMGERTGAVRSATEQIAQVQETLNEANAKIRDLEAEVTRIEQLVLSGEELDTRIRRIEDTLLELRLLLASEQQVSLRMAAIPPRTISMPKWSIMMPLGIVLGLAVGLGLAFMLEFIDTSVKNPSDISRRVDLPVLGMIPHTDDIEEDVEDLRLAFMTNPNSLIGEAFRQIRTCLLFSGPARERRSLLITSPLPEDGRTTVTMNLAAAIAHGGRKVLVVDANFRQPAIRSLFDGCPEGGLSSALVGQANWRDLVHEVLPNLHVMSAGILPPNPAELFGSEEMRKLVAEMVEQYDQVLFDGAPCLVVTDSPILSTLVDGVVLTVRAGANTFGIVQRTRDILLRVNAHIVGVALNAVRVTAGGYLRKSYETFYEYHEQTRLRAE